MAQGDAGSARALALGASGLAGVLLWMGYSRSGTASMEEGTPDERQLSAAQAAAAIRERLNQISPAVAASVLPWQCCAEDGRVSLRFEVKPQSDHFQTLMVALLEMETSAQDGDAGRQSVNAVLSAWDDEADSTGIHVRMLRGDDEGAHLRITLPWTEELLPSVEIRTAEGQGFTRKQAAAMARLIYMANASPGLGAGLEGLGGLHGLLDLFTPPGGGSTLQLPPQHKTRSTQAGGAA